MRTEGKGSSEQDVFFSWGVVSACFVVCVITVHVLS